MRQLRVKVDAVHAAAAAVVAGAILLAVGAGVAVDPGAGLMVAGAELLAGGLLVDVAPQRRPGS